MFLQARDEEKYYLKEFKDDISNCAADYVHVIIDQSFSGNIADAFKNSPDHRNVVVFASGKDNEYAFDDEFTRHWASANHTQECTWQVYKVCKISLHANFSWNMDKNTCSICCNKTRENTMNIIHGKKEIRNFNSYCGFYISIEQTQYIKWPWERECLLPDILSCNRIPIFIQIISFVIAVITNQK